MTQHTDTAPALTWRERRRAETLAEIKATALAQIAAGGVPAVSLNAIARSMGMSPPALYRYFANRDDLLADLVVDVYNDLADVLERVPRRTNPALELRAVSRTSREWALAHPHEYRLIFETPIGSGAVLAPDRVIPAAERTMDVVLRILSALGTPHSVPATTTLNRQLHTWGERSAVTDVHPATLQLGLLWWTRLHGVVTLELAGHLPATGVDARLLFDAEVDSILAHFDP